ncbi:MAG: hypothetical protein OEL76_03960 [Siculibacillus sp.]|nr:hypothetical protein [Siculibacillus sp.]
MAPNVLRLDTQASGFAYIGQTVPATMRLAAKRTLEAGYTHFRLDQVASSQGSQVTGASSTFNGSGQAWGYGNSAWGTMSGHGHTTVWRKPTSNVGVTVIMFRANDPGARDAFKAEDILKRYPKEAF